MNENENGNENRFMAVIKSLGPLAWLIIILVVGLVGFFGIRAIKNRGSTEELAAETESVVGDLTLATATPADMGQLPTVAPPSGACLQVPAELEARFKPLMDPANAIQAPLGVIPKDFCYPSGVLATGTIGKWTPEYLDGEMSFWGNPTTAEQLVIGSYWVPPGKAVLCTKKVNEQGVEYNACLEVRNVDVGPCAVCAGKDPIWVHNMLVATPAVLTQLGIGENAVVTLQSLEATR